MITLKDFMLTTRADIIDGRTGEWITLKYAEEHPDYEVFVFEVAGPNKIRLWIKEKAIY